MVPTALTLETIYDDSTDEWREQRNYLIIRKHCLGLIYET